jgi:hypothetical protein
MLGLAQHYGVPTRLLDWTEKASVAAYFAARGAVGMKPTEKGDLIVWGINQRYILERWNVEDVEVLLVSAPRVSNPNLRAQAGLFTLSQTTGFDKSGPTVTPLDQVLLGAALADVETSSYLIQHLPVVRKVTLSRDHASELLRLLYSHGVDAATICPGLAGVVQSLNEKRHYDRSWVHPWGTLQDPHARAYFGFLKRPENDDDLKPPQEHGA